MHMLASLLECAVSSPRDKRCNIVDDDTAVLRMSLVDANHPLTCQFKSYQALATFGYPPAGTKKFGIWQELGSGADGTVRMASTVPSAIRGSCVTAFAVKFFHGEETKPPAETERDHYHAIYTPHMFPEHAFRVVYLQQQCCLLLPYFAPTPKDLRDEALKELQEKIFPAMTKAQLRLNVGKITLTAGAGILTRQPCQPGVGLTTKMRGYPLDPDFRGGRGISSRQAQAPSTSADIT